MLATFVKEYALCRYVVPTALISDGRNHFIHRSFEALLRKYSLTRKVATPYHSQTSGQVEVSNCEMKSILEKMIQPNRKDWSLKSYDALWAYHTT